MSGTIITRENIIPIDQLLQSLPSSSYDRISNQIVRNAAAMRAINDPLPGPMADAANNQPIEVETSEGIVNVRKMVVYDVTLFKKFNSPFYRQLLESSKEEKDREDVDYSDEESYEMVYQFINPALVVKRMADKGREAFMNASIEEVSLKFDFSDIKLIIDAITVQIMRAFKTMLAHAVPEEGDSVERAINKMAKTAEEQGMVNDLKKK